MSDDDTPITPGSDPESNPLFDFSVEELMDEISNRFDHFIFAGVVHRLEDSDSLYRRYWGDYLQCTGLGQMMSRFCLDSYLDECRAGSDDDDYERDVDEDQR